MPTRGPHVERTGFDDLTKTEAEGRIQPVSQDNPLPVTISGAGGGDDNPLPVTQSPVHTKDVSNTLNEILIEARIISAYLALITGVTLKQ
jgi:hypothetical protein